MADPIKLPPEIPQQIGRLAIGVSLLEATLHAAFAVMMGDDGTKTEIILSRIDSIQFKMDIVFSLADATTPTTPLSSAIVAVKDQISAAVQFRNSVSHAQFLLDDDGNTFILRNAFRLKSATKEEPFKAEQAKVHADALQACIQTIARTLEGKVLTIPKVAKMAPKRA